MGKRTEESQVGRPQMRKNATLTNTSWGQADTGIKWIVKRHWKMPEDTTFQKALSALCRDECLKPREEDYY